MSEEGKFTRRDFVKTIVGGAALASVAQLGALPQQNDKQPEMPTRPLGKTGYNVRLFSLGGQITLETPGKQDEATAIINSAIDLGVNYLDTSPVYGNGTSETYLGTVMKTRRREVFLASKTHDRSYDGSMRLLEQSLKRLQTDHLDLWQLHNLRRQDDVDFVFAREGAIKALEEARRQKMVKFVGVTGHRDPFVVKSALERYQFDTALIALNAADKHAASFIDNVLPLATKQGVGVIAMKVPSRGKLFREGGITTMYQAMRYVLTLPVSTALIGIATIKELEENVRIATYFKPYTEAEMLSLEKLTKPYVADATWYQQLW